MTNGTHSMLVFRVAPETREDTTRVNTLSASITAEAVRWVNAVMRASTDRQTDRQTDGRTDTPTPADPLTHKPHYRPRKKQPKKNTDQIEPNWPKSGGQPRFSRRGREREGEGLFFLSPTCVPGKHVGGVFSILPQGCGAVRLWVVVPFLLLVGNETLSKTVL